MVYVINLPLFSFALHLYASIAKALNLEILGFGFRHFVQTITVGRRKTIRNIHEGLLVTRF